MTLSISVQNQSPAVFPPVGINDHFNLCVTGCTKYCHVLSGVISFVFGVRASLSVYVMYMELHRIVSSLFAARTPIPVSLKYLVDVWAKLRSCVHKFILPKVFSTSFSVILLPRPSLSVVFSIPLSQHLLFFFGKKFSSFSLPVQFVLSKFNRVFIRHYLNYNTPNDPYPSDPSYIKKNGRVQ